VKFLKFRRDTDKQQVMEELNQAYRQGKTVYRDEKDGCITIAGLTDEELAQAQEYSQQKWGGQVHVREYRPPQKPKMSDLPMKDRW
jgi:hypothetical protein